MSHPVRTLTTESPKKMETAVLEAAVLLRAGGVVALPTETVYGLAANALDADAVRKIYEIKGRPAHNPIIVHVASLEMARHCVLHWTLLAKRLAQAFWPGPLTMVLPRSEVIPDIVTAGGTTVGIRWPSHPVVQAVIRECGFPLAAPSANRFSQVSPTTARHVETGLGERIELIIDGGPAAVGIESTVLDLSVSPPRLLRPGMIDAEALVAVAGQLNARGQAQGAVLKSPGQLPKHYAPRAKLLTLSWRDERDLQAQLATYNLDARVTHILAHTQVPTPGGFARTVITPHTPKGFARALYAELHRSDEEGARFIIVEALPDSPEWQALADRLARAAG